MYQPAVSVKKWMVGGAMIGAMSPLASAIPYDEMIQIISLFAGGAFGGAVLGGIIALIINRIRGKKA